MVNYANMSYILFRYYKRSDGLALAAGAFVSALEFSTGIQSIVVGKPEKQFFMGAAKSLEYVISVCVFCLFCNF